VASGVWNVELNVCDVYVHICTCDVVQVRKVRDANTKVFRDIAVCGARVSAPSVDLIIAAGHAGW
jgi:hypothetical protein